MQTESAPAVTTELKSFEQLALEGNTPVPAPGATVKTTINEVQTPAPAPAVAAALPAAPASAPAPAAAEVSPIVVEAGTLPAKTPVMLKLKEMASVVASYPKTVVVATTSFFRRFVIPAAAGAALMAAALAFFSKPAPVIPPATADLKLHTGLQDRGWFSNWRFQSDTNKTTHLRADGQTINATMTDSNNRSYKLGNRGWIETQPQ